MTPKTMQWGTVKTPEEERVPLAFIAPLIQDWEEKYSIGREENYHSAPYIRGNGNREGGLSVLAFHTNISARRLRYLKQGKYEVGDKRHGTHGFADWLPFDMADKIVCATVGPLAWQLEPLNQYYGPLSVKPYERDYEHEEAA